MRVSLCRPVTDRTYRAHALPPRTAQRQISATCLRPRGRRLHSLAAQKLLRTVADQLTRDLLDLARGGLVRERAGGLVDRERGELVSVGTCETDPGIAGPSGDRMRLAIRPDHPARRI